MERVRFITYRGRQILFMDYSELQDPEEIVRLIEQAKETVGQQPENSVLGLVYVRDANTTNTVKEAMKQGSLQNKPYVRATAVVGMSAMQRLVYEAVRLFSSGRTFAPSMIWHPPKTGSSSRTLR